MLTSIHALAHSQYGVERASELLGDLPGALIFGPDSTNADRRLHGRPSAFYFVDVGASTAVAAARAALQRVPYVVDTGDLAFALARSVGGRRFRELLVVGFGEQAMLHRSAGIVVRGHRHKRYLPAGKPAITVRDLPPAHAQPVDAAQLRAKLGILPGQFVVGLVGSISRAPRLGTTYGWDLIDALALCPPCVLALIVGDGSGLIELRARAQARGVAERCVFAGRVESGMAHRYVSVMDVAVSTQTNDAVGSVRTTGKLPLYLASGCPVLASDVGEAHDILGSYGWTVPYRGRVDPTYPEKLAAAIGQLVNTPEDAARRRQIALSIAAREFDRSAARRAVAEFVLEIAPARQPDRWRRNGRQEGSRG